MVFGAYLDFLDASGAYSVAMAQGGDFIGGASGAMARKEISRKVMNTFFCRTDRYFQFIGSINEDANTYVSQGNIGKLFFTVPRMSITQKATQTNSGGMTGTYIDNGTYLKTFYTVMLAPSCVKISTMGDKHTRIHHEISWKYAVPNILNQRYKKGD